MKKIKFNNLFLKISVVFFLLLVFIGLAYVFITVSYSKIYFAEVNQRINRNTAADISSHSTPFTNGEVNSQAMAEMFNHVMSINPSLEVYLLDNNGKILSFYAPVKKIIMEKINLDPVRKYISSNGNEFITGDDPRNPNLKKAFSVAPILSNGKQSGYIYVVLTSEEYDTVSKNLANSFFLRVGLRSMLLTLFTTLLVGVFVIRIITKNISKIIEVSQKFREGDTNARVDIQTNGEEKILGEMFNNMADILSQNIEKLKTVEVLRRELIANVSHDLRTPIAIIKGYVETLQIKENTISPEERNQYVNTISISVAKLEKLVNELFELSKLEANQVIANKEPLIISELISDICNKYQLLANSKNITLHTDLSKDIPPVFADVSLIERVMQNLIDNALKFTPYGGNIVIKTKLGKDNDVVVSIVDDGNGISEKDQEQIFTRYYKANDFSHLKNNTGLGLAIAKKILDLHNSKLELISSENVGSTFLFRLSLNQ